MKSSGVEEGETGERGGREEEAVEMDMEQMMVPACRIIPELSPPLL